jgi:peptidylprolyl isomerase
MSRRQVLLATLVLSGLSLAACGSSSKVSATTSSVGPQPSGTATFAAGPVPAVAGATDLSKEPVVSAVATPPPTVLTGRDLVVGTGATAAASATVNVQYVGALYATGKLFDASWTDNGPASFALSGVIAGFKDAIIGMKVGGRREIVIPPSLGYGAGGSPPAIPGNATLVFVIDLLGVTP